MISREVCERVLRKAVATGADYAEIFAENTINHSIDMIASKVDAIKDENLWLEVRDLYLDKKNMYLSRGDKENHPSFNVYIETVNEIYYKYFR